MLAPLTRRDVLAAGLALGSAPFLSKRAWASPQQGGSFAYFSDSHVSLKRNAAECRAMLEELRGVFTPAFAINGGDVVDYGWKGEYDTYDTVLAGLAWKTHHIPGNHDVRWSPLGLKIFSGRVGAPYSSFDAFGCRLVLLDSTVPLSHWGHYESEQLRWLERTLKDTGREMPVIVATHHWVGRDQVMVDNESALMRVLEPYNVKLVLTGHGHNDLLWHWDAALCTMNKGLYQGSYQRVDVDWQADRLRLFRRTTQRPNLRLLAEVPLKAPRESRRIWTTSYSTSAGGKCIVSPDLVGAKEFRWNDGPWTPIPETPIVAEGLSPGTHLASFRKSATGRQHSKPVEVRDEVGRVKVFWATKLPGGVMSHLVLAEEKLFVSCMDGSVLAFEPSSGKEVWKAKTGGYCHSSPCVSDGLLVVGSADGSVYCFDSKTGAKKWSFATGGPVYASAAIANGRAELVPGGDKDGSPGSRSGATRGSRTSKTQRPDGVPDGWSSQNPPKGLAMIGSGDGKVYGLRLEDGSPKWTYALPPSDTAFTQSVPQTDGERLYFGGWDKYTYALSVETGELVWRKLCTASTFAFSPAIGGPAMGPEAIYIPANGNELYAFRKSDGELLWKGASSGDKVGYSAPCLAGGKLYIGCLGDKGEARCFSAADGKELWTAKVGAVIYDSSPAYSDGLVAVGSVNGTLSLIDASDGSIFAQYRMPTGHFLSSPAMEGRRIYAATYSDELVCLEAVR